MAAVLQLKKSPNHLSIANLWLLTDPWGPISLGLAAGSDQI